jgi:hypothetical protein
MYSPKISEDLIPVLYRLGKKQAKPMTKVIDGILRFNLNGNGHVITPDEFRAWLRGKKFILDCGHRFCIHPLSNTMIVHDDGMTQCHSCGY